MSTSLFRLLFIIFISAMAGCSTWSTVDDRQAQQVPQQPQMPYPPSRALVVGDIMHMRTGFFVSEDEMLAAATDARIVYLGETHNNMASHHLQLKVLKAMADRWSGQVALGMEMFIPDQQEALDRWIAGDFSEAEFLKASRWKELWHLDFDYYKPLLQFARDNGIPVIGINAPKSLVHAVARKDFSELTEEQRRQLPDIDMNAPYRDALSRAVYGGHAKGSNGLEGFTRVQALWDESMAENAVRYLNSPDGQDRRMVVVAGGNHIRYGFGIPRAVFRRLPASYVLIGTRAIVI
ncbi:MAG: ChaN family lipoprotein, partial [Gammaproteobacteria bacterium]